MKILILSGFICGGEMGHSRIGDTQEECAQRHGVTTEEWRAYRKELNDFKITKK